MKRGERELEKWKQHRPGPGVSKEVLTRLELSLGGDQRDTPQRLLSQHTLMPSYTDLARREEKQINKQRMEDRAAR